MHRQTITTASPESEPYNYYGGPGTLFAQDEFGGGYVKLQYAVDLESGWNDATDSSGAVVTLTETGTLAFEVAPCLLRAALIGSADAVVDIKIAENQSH